MSVKKYPLLPGTYGLAVVREKDNILYVNYRGTDLVTWDKTKNTATLRMDGWRGPTNNNGINCFLKQVSRNNIHRGVYTRNHVTYYGETLIEPSDDIFEPSKFTQLKEVPFEEGMTIEL